MQAFTRKKRYKAKDPAETVAGIQAILKDTGINVREERRYEDAPDVASCRIWLSDADIGFADFGTNGKGMNAEYSLASAYGEMMERLQNFILFGDYPEDVFRKGLTRFMTAPDEVMLDAEEAYDEGRSVIDKLMRIDGEDRSFLNYAGRDKMPCVPYLDLFEDRQILLPHKTLRMVTGSNGMCAGNTYMEAVTQGLSELYERAAVMECYRDDPVIRKIDPEQFRGNAIYDRLKRLESKGFGFSILDLSMGKNYPVVGLLLEKDGKKAFKAGADPCPVTALERCLTETFQGTEREISGLFKSECCPPFKDADLRSRYMINDAEIAYHVDGSGKAAYCLFNPKDEYTDSFKGTDAESERSDYEYMISLTKKLGYSLYIRDWSFMGFPAYHVVVPEISNYDLLYEDGGDIYGFSFDKIEFRQDRLTEGCARILNRMFEKYENNTPVQDKSMQEQI